MKNLLKQLGKSLCYVCLFGGMQFIAYFIAMMQYGVKAAVEAANNGEELSQLELAEGMMDYLTQSTGWVLILSAVMTLLFVWFLFAVRKKKILKETNIVPFEANRIIPVIILAVSAVAAVECAFSILPIPESLLMEYEESIMGLFEGSTLSIILSTVIAAPIVEEVIFRGLVLSRLKKAMPVAVAAILSSLAFGYFHGQIVWVCYATLLGILMCFVAINCRSTLASIFFHMIFNLLGGMPIVSHLLGENMVPIMIAEILALIAGAAAISWMCRLSGGMEQI